jgi:hypothetical protein
MEPSLESLGWVIRTEPLPPDYLSAIDKIVILCAEFWPDEFFDVPDGKKWRLLVDGESIFARHEEPLTASNREWLDNQAGVIVDVSGTDEKPMYFEDDQALEDAWEELQRTYGVEADIYLPA